MNPFEEHIRANKEALNPDKVNPEIWLSIENKMLKQKNRRGRLYLRILGTAAAILLIAVIALRGFASTEQQDIHAQILESYGLQAHEFPKTINAKKAALSKAKIPLDRQADFQILLRQLQFLDKQYDDYLDYVKQHGYQDFIGEQILSYYKTKIELLDKINIEIKKIDSYENKYDDNSPQVELNL